MLINYEGVGTLQVCDECGTALQANPVTPGAFCPRPICNAFYRMVYWEPIMGDEELSPNNTPVLIGMKRTDLFLPIAIHLHEVSRGTHRAYLGS